tara:strand:- start:374 stop:553 length:180 start_codon:yes stop_codon:yes gene_type:complete
MANTKYEPKLKSEQVNKNVNVVDLINRAKDQDRIQKKQSVYIGAIAVSVLAVAGFVISQ